MQSRLEETEKRDCASEAKMEEDWDSDETVIEGSVTDSDLEEDELPGRR